MADDDPAREALRDGDRMMKAAEYAAAVRAYAIAARLFDAAGHSLKAAAVFKHIRAFIRKHAIAEPTVDEEARARLPILFRALGLEARRVRRKTTTFGSSRDRQSTARRSSAQLR